MAGRRNRADDRGSGGSVEALRGAHRRRRRPSTRATDSRGQTALMWAAARNNAAAVRLLVEAPAPTSSARTGTCRAGIAAPGSGRDRRPGAGHQLRRRPVDCSSSPPPTGFTRVPVRRAWRQHRRGQGAPRCRRERQRHAVRRSDRARSSRRQTLTGSWRTCCSTAAPIRTSTPSGWTALHQAVRIAPSEHRLRHARADPDRDPRQHPGDQEDDRARRQRQRAHEPQRHEGRAAQPPEPARCHAVSSSPPRTPTSR